MGHLRHKRWKITFSKEGFHLKMGAEGEWESRMVVKTAKIYHIHVENCQKINLESKNFKN